ncbi:MAG: hypothetical protein OXD44_09605 [Gammaproteobacteria bacterium]|nr:hypothetical protein [Gammaproteobacteria bacterium]
MTKPIRKTEPRRLNIKPGNYQPGRKEYSEMHDMPGMNDNQIRNAFFKPFQIATKNRIKAFVNDYDSI